MSGSSTQSIEESSFEEVPIALKESLSNTEVFEEASTTLECEKAKSKT